MGRDGMDGEKRVYNSLGGASTAGVRIQDEDTGEIFLTVSIHSFA